MAYNPVNPNGQETMANSSPVVVASNQSSIPVTATNAGTFVVQENGAALTALQLIDDIIVAQGTALGSTKLGLVGGAVTTAAPTFTTGNINQLSLTTSGALRVDLGATSANATAVKVDGSASTQPVSGTVTANAGTNLNTSALNLESTQSAMSAKLPATLGQKAMTASMAVVLASDQSSIPVAATLTAETTKVIGVTRTADGSGNLLTSNSTTYTAKFGLDSNILGTLGTAFSTPGFVDIKGADGNVFVRQTTASNLNAQAVGNVAHDAADSGNPIKVGNKAIALGTNPTGVAAGDRTDAYANRAGIPFVIGGHPNIITQEFTVLASDGAQTNLALVSVSAGTKIVVTKCSAVASSANSVSVNVRVGFGTATLPATSLAGATGIILSHPAIAAGSGVVEGNGSGIIGIGADDEDVRLTCDSPTSGSIRIVVCYHTIES